MRSILFSCSVLALILSFAPASAMCGGIGTDQQAQSTGQGAMMCGRPSASTQAEDPFGMKVEPQQQSQGGVGMCQCCRGMAMMPPGPQRDDPHKGMNMSPKP